MKKLRTFYFFLLLVSSYSVNYSQGLSAGFLSGINFSDIHGNSGSGKWNFKSGAVESIFINYSLNKMLGFQTGVGVSTFYYENVSYEDITRIPYMGFSSSSYFIPDPIYYRYREKMDFTFLTFPAQVKLSIPSRPALNLTAGMYYSFLTDYSYDYYYTDDPRKRDFGYLISTGLSHPVSKKMDVLFDISYVAGLKRFVEHAGYKHGSMDFRFGLAFKNFLPKKSDIDYNIEPDSVSSRISLLYKGGINASRNFFGSNEGSYSSYFGPSLGFSVNFRLSDKTVLVTGLSFEKTGYSLKDSSDSFYRYFADNDPVYYVDTKTITDYVCIPALLEIRLGEPGGLYFNTGPYVALRLNTRCTGEAFSVSNDNGTYYLRKYVVYDDLEGITRIADFGWMFGGGVTIKVLEKYSLDLGLNYRKGFRDAVNEEYYQNMTIYERETSAMRNRILSFCIGVRVPVYR